MNWRFLFAAWPDQEEGEQGAGGAGGEDGQGEPAAPGDRREREPAEHGAGEAADVVTGDLHSVIHHKLIIHTAHLIPIWIIPELSLTLIFVVEKVYFIFLHERRDYFR